MNNALVALCAFAFCIPITRHKRFTFILHYVVRHLILQDIILHCVKWYDVKVYIALDFIYVNLQHIASLAIHSKMFYNISAPKAIRS